MNSLRLTDMVKFQVQSWADTGKLLLRIFGVGIILSYTHAVATIQAWLLDRLIVGFKF